jgi:metallo-beta-lactamase family protein
LNLTFLGAARVVTGSMYLLTLDDGYNILVDCGLNYEKNIAREENANFPFDPYDIDLVVLTHAHVDHSGNIPTLFAKGYEGKVLCTEPTWRLADILLMDSAKIENARVSKANRSRNRKGKQAHKKESEAFRLFGQKQVMDAVGSMITLEFNTTFQLRHNVSVTLIPAGHILGAASVVFEITEGKKTKRLGFTGDLGKSNAKIIVPPQIPTKLDYLVMEGTYGDRIHQETRTPEDVLEEYIERVCVENKGRLVIPAFSVGRTQAILFTINKLMRDGRIPSVKVFTDSPLGIKSGNIHQEFKHFLNDEAQSFVQEHHDLFLFKELYIVEDQDDETFVSNQNHPCIIVSSAGMLEGGRIQRHIANNIQNQNSTILMAGFCTPGTLGHTLLSGAKNVAIKGRSYLVFADIQKTDAFSAHPDQTELLKYFDEVQANSNLKKVFVSHGEEASLLTMKDKISERGVQTVVPVIGETFELN